MTIWLALLPAIDWNAEGIRAHKNRDYAAAESAYRRAAAEAASHEDKARIMSNLAVLHRAQGHYAHAEADFRLVIAMRIRALGPHHADTIAAWNNLGELHFRMARHELAQHELEYALDHATPADRPAIQHNLAYVLLARGRHDAATTAARRALDGKIAFQQPARDLVATTNLLDLLRAARERNSLQRR